MIRLLDTHGLIWARAASRPLAYCPRSDRGSGKRDPGERRLGLGDCDQATGRLRAPEEFAGATVPAGFRDRAIALIDTGKLRSSPAHPRDPSDHMLVAQAPDRLARPPGSTAIPSASSDEQQSGLARPELAPILEVQGCRIRLPCGVSSFPRCTKELRFSSSKAVQRDAPLGCPKPNYGTTVVPCCTKSPGSCAGSLPTAAVHPRLDDLPRRDDANLRVTAECDRLQPRVVSSASAASTGGWPVSDSRRARFRRIDQGGLPVAVACENLQGTDVRAATEEMRREALALALTAHSALVRSSPSNRSGSSNKCRRAQRNSGNRVVAMFPCKVIDCP
jgi:hypothetical protein